MGSLNFSVLVLSPGVQEATLFLPPSTEDSCKLNYNVLIWDMCFIVIVALCCNVWHKHHLKMKHSLFHQCIL